MLQSDNLLFDQVKFKEGAALLWRISGERVKKIDIIHTDGSTAKEKLVTELGADAKEIKW